MPQMLRDALRKRWKVVLVIVGLWLVFLFPIPLFPLWGIHLDENSLETVIIISLVVSIPFTFLAIFINKREYRDSETASS